jgi:type II secretory pathway pseudopilin PulG
MSLSAQTDARKISETRKQLQEIKDALLGFAAANGRLPCPDADTDPTLPNYGVEDIDTCDKEGYLPWKTLGSYEYDPWGAHRTQVTDPPSGRWRYRVDKTFTTNITLAISTSSKLAVVDMQGNALTNSGDDKDRPVAIVFSRGPDGESNGLNVTAANVVAPPATGSLTYQADTPSLGFDDELLWISRPVLLNRLIAAGRAL